MSVNVCLDDIFWTAEHFVTKLGMVIQHCDPDCHAEKELSAVFKVKVMASAHYDQKMDLPAITSELLIPGQPNLVWWYIIIFQSALWKKKNEWLHSRSRSQWRVKMSVFVQMISSKQPNILLPNLVLWCIIMSRSVMQKDWFAIFKVKVTVKVKNFIESLCIIHLLYHWSFGNQTRCAELLLIIN